VTRLNRSGMGNVLVIWCCLVMPVAVSAQADAAPPKQDRKVSPPPTAGQIAVLVDQLTSRDFRVRRAASKRLIAAGKVAIGPVAKAADGSDLERTTRCLAVLKQLQASDDDSTKTAAGTALRKLAASKNATVARRAEAALPKPDPKLPLGGIRRGGVRIQGVVGNASRISVRVTNGQRTIEAKEGDRKVLINDSNGKNIRMTITRKVKGKVEAREVKASTAEELKKADPEAYKLYQQYTANNALQIKIQRFGQAVPGNRRRPLPLGRARPVLPLPRFSPWHQQVEVARKHVDAAVATLQKLAAKPQAKPGEIREVLQQLVDAQKALSALLAAPGKISRPAKKAPAPKADRVPSRPQRPAPKARPKLIKTGGA